MICIAFHAPVRTLREVFTFLLCLNLPGSEPRICADRREAISYAKSSLRVHAAR